MAKEQARGTHVVKNVLTRARARGVNRQVYIMVIRHKAMRLGCTNMMYTTVRFVGKKVLTK